MRQPVGGVLGVEGTPAMYPLLNAVPSALRAAEQATLRAKGTVSFADTWRAIDTPDETGLIGPGAGVRTVGSDIPFHDLFNTIGQRYQIAPELLASVARVESGFRTDARSDAGAEGLMQFMPETAATYGVDAWDPASSIDGAARFLSDLYNQFGSVSQALAAYNGGPTWLMRNNGVPVGGPARYAQAVLSALGESS